MPFLSILVACSGAPGADGNGGLGQSPVKVLRADGPGSGLLARNAGPDEEPAPEAAQLEVARVPRANAASARPLTESETTISLSHKRTDR